MTEKQQEHVSYLLDELHSVAMSLKKVLFSSEAIDTAHIKELKFFLMKATHIANNIIEDNIDTQEEDDLFYCAARLEKLCNKLTE